MYSYAKHGFKTIAEVLYDEPNEIFNISPEEREKNASFLSQFKGGLKAAHICQIKDLSIPSPLDKRY